MTLSATDLEALLVGDSADIPSLSDAEFAKLIAQPAPAGFVPASESVIRWEPKLTPKQREVFYSTEPNLLVVGSRYTGKGWCCAYRAVKEAYDHWNNLVLIIVRTKRQALAGGIFSKLYSEILPDFAKNLSDFHWEGPKTTAEKDLILEVTNRYGGTSIIQLMSIQHDADVEKRLRGIEAGFIILDEGQLFEDENVHSQLEQCLKRRNHILPEKQNFIVNCNPREPEHWIHRFWFEDFKDSPSFRVIELLYDSNPDPKVVNYYEMLKRQLRNQPYRYARDVEGKWVAAPTGESLFVSVFVRGDHVKGDLATQEFLHPHPSFNITVGWDIGDTNHGVTFLQECVTPEKTLWMAFDEVEVVKRNVSIEALTEMVMKKMHYWCDTVGHDFRFTHISDKSAFNRFRAAAGSFDHLLVQKESARLLPRFPRLKEPIKARECPKPPGSVAARIRILRDMIGDGRFYVSAKCVNLIKCIECITGSKGSPDEPSETSIYKHLIDSTTYPLFYHNVGGEIVARPAVTPSVRVLRS